MDRRRNISIYDNPTPGTSSSQSSQSSSRLPGSQSSQTRNRVTGSQSSQTSNRVTGSQSSQSSRVTGTQSSASGYTPSSSLTSSSSSSDTETIRDLVHSILVLHQTKVPFRRIDMAKMMDGNQKRMTDEAIEAAGRHLKQVFGFRLVPVEGNETHYVLVKARKRACFTKRPVDTDAHDAVLTLVLGVIFMTAETGCSLEKIREFLTLIGMRDESEVWTGSETMKMKDLLMRHWVKQLYLEKFDNEDILTKRNETTMGWGFRARQEFDKKQVLDLVSEVMGTTADQWREQFARADEDGDGMDVTVIAAGPSVSSGQRREGRTHRLVVDLTRNSPVGRGILSESNRINRQNSSQSSSRSRP